MDGFVAGLFLTSLMAPFGLIAVLSLRERSAVSTIGWEAWRGEAAVGARWERFAQRYGLQRTEATRIEDKVNIEQELTGRLGEVRVRVWLESGILNHARRRAAARTTLEPPLSLNLEIHALGPDELPPIYSARTGDEAFDSRFSVTARDRREASAHLNAEVRQALLEAAEASGGHLHLDDRGASLELDGPLVDPAELEEALLAMARACAALEEASVAAAMTTDLYTDLEEEPLSAAAPHRARVDARS